MFSSSSSSSDCFRPLRRESSRLTGDALLPPLADDCLCPVVDTPYTVGRCEPFPGSEYPSSWPECSMVRLVLSAGPSGASDWVGNQDVYDTAGGIIYLWIGHSLVRPFRSDDSPIRRIWRYDTNPPRYAQVSGSEVLWCLPMETRHRDCCLFLFSSSSARDVGVSFRLHSQRAAGKYVGYSPLQHDDCTVVI